MVQLWNMYQKELVWILVVHNDIQPMVVRLEFYLSHEQNLRPPKSDQLDSQTFLQTLYLIYFNQYLNGNLPMQGQYIMYPKGSIS